jgi:hypothetical protein
MASRYDNAAIIVASLGDHGRITAVKRFMASESASAEATIVALVNAGQQLRVTFIGQVGTYAISETTQERLAGLVT